MLYFRAVKLSYLLQFHSIIENCFDFLLYYCYCLLRYFVEELSLQMLMVVKDSNLIFSKWVHFLFNQIYKCNKLGQLEDYILQA